MGASTIEVRPDQSVIPPGMVPIKYLQHWRMALAKDGLRSGKRSIGEIALAIGFQSSMRSAGLSDVLRRALRFQFVVDGQIEERQNIAHLRPRSIDSSALKIHLRRRPLQR
jgi:hypothetical protein